MPAKRAKKSSPKLNGRDQQLIELFLQKIRSEFVDAFTVARDMHRAAPGVPGFYGAMQYRTNGISAIDHMLSRLNSRFDFLSTVEGYCDTESEGQSCP